MGTRMAPTYANLYMGQLEEQLLEQTTLKPLVWFRFIDNIFFLWMFGQTKLQQFFSACNGFDPHKIRTNSIFNHRSLSWRTNDPW